MKKPNGIIHLKVENLRAQRDGTEAKNNWDLRPTLLPLETFSLNNNLVAIITYLSATSIILNRFFFNKFLLLFPIKVAGHRKDVLYHNKAAAALGSSLE